MFNVRKYSRATSVKKYVGHIKAEHEKEEVRYLYRPPSLCVKPFEIAETLLFFGTFQTFDFHLFKNAAGAMLTVTWWIKH